MGWLVTRVPPPVIAAVVGLLMWVDTMVFDGISLPGRGFDVAGLMVAVAGLGVAGWAGREFARARTTFDPHHIEQAAVLVTTGPYRLSRNPMYLGLLAALTGFGLALGDLLSMVFGMLLFVVVLTVLQIRPEERMLSEKFGDRYEDYRRQVRRWI